MVATIGGLIHERPGKRVSIDEVFEQLEQLEEADDVCRTLDDGSSRRLAGDRIERYTGRRNY